jgi:RNA polymerase sigma factor (sigma-70 family)
MTSDAGVVPEFGSLIPEFVRVLRHLVRLGYYVEEYQGLEIVHDFYADAWSGLLASFQPEKGTFTSYARGAFSRFARRRLLREARWRQLLVPELVDAARASDEIVATTSGELAEVRNALEALSDDERELVRLRFAEGFSERAISQRLRITRYHVRQGLAAALARIAASIREGGELSPFDLRVSRLVFLEEKPIATVALELGVTDAAVRMASRRIIGHLANGLGARQ